MTADALSQDEIDALLGGFADSDEETGQAGISPDEREALSQLQAATAQAVGNVLEGLVDPNAHVTPGEMVEATNDAPATLMQLPAMDIHTRYTKGLEGLAHLVLGEADALALVSGMMGGSEVSEMDELAQSALSEAGSQIHGAANSALGEQLKTDIAVEPPQVTAAPDEAALKQLIQPLGKRFVLLRYDITCGEREFEMQQMVSNELIGAILSAAATAATAAAPKPTAAAASTPAREVAPVEFAELEPSPEQGSQRSLDLILDINLTVKVELGRTRRQVRDILSLTQGAVIELNKLVGEPLDILVNEQLFARGEVVVIDENFGVRVTEILSQQERIEALKSRANG